MRKLLVLSLIVGLALGLAVSCKPSGALSTEPAKPEPGKPVTVTYRPAGTPLAEAPAVSLVAYVYTKGMPTAVETIMTRKDSAWTATFTPEAKSRGAVLKFVNGDIVDSNKRKGYFLPLYDAQGRVVPGCYAGLAEAYNSWGDYFAGIDSDQALALSYFEKEFAAHPDMKREYLSSYLNVIAREKKAEAEKIVLAELGSLAARTDLNKDDLNTLIYWYNREKKPEEARAFVPKLLALDPTGDFAQGQKFQMIYQVPDPAQKVEMAEAFKKEFPTSQLIPQLDYVVVGSFIQAGEWKKALAYLDSQSVPAAALLYNQLARQVSQDPKAAKDAEAIAVQAVDLARKELASPAQPKPSYQTEAEWKDQRSSTLAECLDTQGSLLLGLNRAEEADKALEEAVSLTRGRTPEIDEHYAVALSMAAEPKTVLDRIAPLVKDGNATARMKDILKSAYVKDKGGETGWDAYLSGLETAAREKLRAELVRQMLDLPAAPFSLNDLEGKPVSLESLKGKVVILDFWATWCGPCQAAFPGMKTYVEKVKDDPKVAVLFINSWERAQDKKKNAQDFLASNGYPFRVLLDDKDAVIDAYKVDGIPTKFVIDGKGRVRFKSVGYMGSPDKLVDELSLMVDMIR
jgi:thiol-disulfide isomerase/thioredoxin